MATLRKVTTLQNADGTRRAVVYRDAEWGEFRVCFTLNGTEKPRADYFTDDKGDAIGTARAMCHLPPVQRQGGAA